MNTDWKMQGRQLDLLVAEKVMGWQRPVGPGNWIHPDGHGSSKDEIPKYALDIAAAWQVVEKMHADGEILSLIYLSGVLDDLSKLGWQAEFRHSRTFGVATTAPLAICRAALAAVSHVSAAAS